MNMILVTIAKAQLLPLVEICVIDLQNFVTLIY